MKRILFVLALMLILTVCFVGEAFALNHPWTEADDNDSGDDYPWGGDNTSEDTTPPSIKSNSYISFATGISISNLIIKYFYLDDISTIKSTSVEKQVPRTNRIRHIKYSTMKSEGTRK